MTIEIGSDPFMEKPAKKTLRNRLDERQTRFLEELAQIEIARDRAKQLGIIDLEVGDVEMILYGYNLEPSV